MNHSQKYRVQGKRLLWGLVPMLLLFAVFTILCLAIPPTATATGSSNVPQVGSPPVGNAGWQADQVDRQQAWWKAGRPGGGQGSQTPPPQGPWVPPIQGSTGR